MRDAGSAQLLLERDREVESLRSALAHTVNGGGRLALVEGPAGIGKSRLLAELRNAAQEDDMRVLTARGSELEREFPFGVVRQLFEPSLTDGEARVAKLAADGQTNRDIAQALYVTPKTVEVHLTNAYRKLNIGSRRELPAALAST
jgi:ATP/maltotriose-dependent transcriptional regulator MalT